MQPLYHRNKQPPHPPAGEESFHRHEDNGVRSMISASMVSTWPKKFCLSTSPTPTPERNGTPTEDDGVSS